MPRIVLELLTLALGLATAGQVRATPQDYWPQWRGPLGSGASATAQPPVEWSESKHIRWKTPLPGKGHSTPIVWGERIFVTAAIPHGEAVKPRLPSRPGAHDNLPLTHDHEFAVIALDRKSGNILWQESVHREVPHEAGHITASLASASPVTDGERIYAFFGSRGLYCFDSAGKLLWKKHLGTMHTKHGHGEGSSPALHGETLVVNWDHEEQSFLIAFDKRTGATRWRIARSADTSWSTPVIVEHAGKTQVIVAATNSVCGHDLATGAVTWECAGLSSNVVATPVAADGVLYAGSSYETRMLMAIRLMGARGNITGSDHVLWSRRRGAPYVPSPLLYGGVLYTLQHYQGIVSRLDAVRGEDRGGPFRLDALESIYASPVAAANRVYITSREGLTQVVRHDNEDLRTLAVNRLDDSFSASAALAGRELFLRGERYLYCIGND